MVAKPFLTFLLLLTTFFGWFTANAFAPPTVRSSKATSTFTLPIRTNCKTTTTTPTPTRRLASTVIDEPITIEKTDRDTTPDRAQAGTKLPAFLLRLWNDPYNKREFVARCLAEVCGKSDTESFQIMMHAHQSGMGIIGQYDFEIAELYLQSLRERALLVDMIPVEGKVLEKRINPRTTLLEVAKSPTLHTLVVDTDE